MFCKKCGSLILPKTQNGKKVFVCSCGFSPKDIKAADTKIKECVKTEKAEDMPVIEEEMEPLPIIEAQCPKCNHGKAYFWTIQTRPSDEPETKFMKCEKCSHVWRDYS
jgi:transcription factor S